MKRFGMVAFVSLMMLSYGCADLKIKIPPLFGSGDAGEGRKAEGKTTEGDDGEPAAGDDRGTRGLPDASGRGWVGTAMDIASVVMLGAEHGALYYAYDSLAYPGREVHLAVRLRSLREMKNMANVTVSFYRGRKLIGRSRTDAGGLAHMAWTPPKIGNYHLRARITEVADSHREFLAISDTSLLVVARSRDTPIVVIDLDHTIVDAGFFRVLLGGAKPMDRSLEVTKRIAKEYTVVYLTQRPEVLTRKSKLWLVKHGYPAGPIMLSAGKVFLDSGRFKTGKLKALRRAYPNVRFGIGDKFSDTEAYVANGLKAYLIPHCKDKPKDLRKMASRIRRLPGSARLHVVDNWYDIEAGIFDGKTFPPATYARALDRRASRIEAEKRAKKEKDDDD